MTLSVLPRALVLASLALGGTGGLLHAGDTDPKAERREARHERILARFDANHDGKLEKSERMAMREARFERLDANHDGSISHDEFMNRHHGHAAGGTN